MISSRSLSEIALQKLAGFLFTCSLALSGVVASAEPIGFIERYALAKDRTAALAELVPGTEEYFYYHCLHYQLTGQLEEADAMLARWPVDKTFVKSRYNRLRQSIEDRQRLLTYSTSPDRTINHLQKRLEVQLEHPAPRVAGVRRFPSRLDESTIDVERWLTGASINNLNLTLQGWRLLSQRLKPNDLSNHTLLQNILHRVDGRWVPDLQRLVIAELKLRSAQQRILGDMPAHQHLTLQQLQEVGSELPDLALSQSYINAILARLRPNDDTNMSLQPQVRRDYLQRLDEFATLLPDTYNGLKATILFQLMQSDLAMGQPNRETLLRYLRLPRFSSFIVTPVVDNTVGSSIDPFGSVPFDSDPFNNMGTSNDFTFSDKFASGKPFSLATDYTQNALLPSIGDEEPLLRTMLEIFLKDAESTSDFDGLLKSEFLNEVFAESKLLHGVAPADRWYGALGAVRAQQIRDRVELTLSPENPLQHPADSASVLKVDIKNVDSLVIRIYKINCESYYRTHEKTIDTDIDLDALLPTVERTIRYSQNAVLRHREVLPLDEIKGRGVWIVDLLGGGLRARALIRRGDLRPIVTPSANGTRIVAVDENRKPVPAARFILTGREVVADNQGTILLPPSDTETTRKIVLSDGNIAVPVQVTQPAESYTLTAGMFLDRQQLQAGRSIDLMIRPYLTMSGNPIAPESLTDLSVEITATDLDGITTRRQIGDLTMNQAQQIVVPVRVPPRLATLSATFSGLVTTIATNKVDRVQVSKQWQVASTDPQRQTRDTYLTRENDDWVIEVLGLSGEPIQGAELSISLKSELRQEPIRVMLQSDDNGKVVLGPLKHIESIDVTLQGMKRLFPLIRSQAPWPTALHCVSGKETRIALPRDVSEAKGNFRLIEMRSSAMFSDESDRLSVADGMLILPELFPGNYQLLDLNTDVVVEIAVTDGPVIENVALGTVRHLSLPLGTPVGIAAVDKTNDGLKIRISGANELTRVHIVAGRYYTDTDPLFDLKLPFANLYSQSLGIPVSGYLSDLQLGDEYQYVMRRKYVAKYPGVMLPQPGLILNPWETETTANNRENLSIGDAPAPAAPMMDGAVDPKQQGDHLSERSGALRSTFDFLADSGVTLANLQPDAAGEVVIAQDVIDAMPLIHIVVTDPVSIVRRTIYGPLAPVPSQDLRLQTSIDPDRHYTFVRSVVSASQDQPLDVKSLGSAQVQVYSSIADLLDLYITLVSDARMAEFREIGQWHTFDEQTKQSLYGRLACHELHLFLSVHDRPFFESVVRPYVANKKEKQFVDHYLLDNDLEPFTTPWAFERLNALEMSLLARRKPEIREVVVRRLRELTEVAMDDSMLRRQLIDTALAGRSLSEATPALGIIGDFAVAQDSDSDMYGMGGMGGGMGGMGGAMGGMGGMGGGGTEDREMQDLRSRALSRRSAANNAMDEARQMEATKQESMFGRVLEKRASDKSLAFFQQLDLTKQWAESHWDQTRVAAANSNLIEVNQFWLDIAESAGNDRSISQNVLLPTGDRHSALAALAFCGLPLDSSDVTLPTDGTPFKPIHPVAVITKQLSELREDDAAKQNGSIVVGQTFDFADAQDPQRQTKPPAGGAPDEYIAGETYFARIVLTNPTAIEQDVDLLWQIPTGSLPLANYKATDSQTVTIAPFQVKIISYKFYFPLPGEFTHYPVCVASNGMMAARGAKRVFNVVAVPTKMDEASWKSVAEKGDAEKIRTFLQTANLQEIDWNLVLHRLSERVVYDAVTDVLDAQKISNQLILGYALRHRDIEGLQRFLAENPTIVESVGPVFQSDLLDVDPIERGFYEQLEYAPLVNARTHRLREKNEILNPTLLMQYVSLLRMMAYTPETTDIQRLALTYYLILQNRIEEALETFAKVDSDKVETKLQYSYLAAYLALHRGDYETAEKIAAAERLHPVPRWRARFETLASQLSSHRQWMSDPQKIAGNAGQANPAVRSDDSDLALMDRDQRGAESAALEPSVEVKIDGRSLEIVHRNATSAVLNLYAVDPELLFSKTPFVRDDLAKMAIVNATRTERIELTGTANGAGVRGATRYLLDEDLSRQTLMVEVIAGPARSTALYYGGNLAAYVSEGFGQVQVTDASTGTPVETAYVKVYARHNGGEVRFYKDGYTDLRGRFDFASISNGDLSTVERFSILVIDPKRGATIKESRRP